MTTPNEPCRRIGIPQCRAPGCPCKEFAVRLLRVMNQRGFGTWKLSKHAREVHGIHLHENQIRRYCRSASLPEFHGVLALARVLDVPVEYLMTGQNPPADLTMQDAA